MIDFNISVEIVEYCIHLCMHFWFQQCRVIKYKTDIVGGLGNVYSAKSSQLRGIGKFEEIEYRIAAESLGRQSVDNQ